MRIAYPSDINVGRSMKGGNKDWRLITTEGGKKEEPSMRAPVTSFLLLRDRRGKE